MEPEPVNTRPARRITFGAICSALVALLAIFPLALFLFAQLGRYFFFAELIGNFRFQMMVLLIPFPFLLFAVRRWKFGMIMAIATAWSVISVLATYSTGVQPPAGTQQLKMMTFNVFDKNKATQEVINRIQNSDPDIVSIIEYTNHWLDEFEQIHDKYPYRITEPRWHGYGIALFSKYPFEQAESVRISKSISDVPVILAEVRVGNDLLRIVGIHIFSPMSRFRMNARNDQLKEIAKIVRQKSIPTVVLGDFNCTPWSPFLLDFLKSTRLRDSRQGFGYQATWPTVFWPIAIPIDHAFVSQEIHVHDRTVEPAGGSDHCPVSIVISIHQDESSEKD